MTTKSKPKICLSMELPEGLDAMGRWKSVFYRASYLTVSGSDGVTITAPCQVSTAVKGGQNMADIVLETPAIDGFIAMMNRVEDERNNGGKPEESLRMKLVRIDEEKDSEVLAADVAGIKNAMMVELFPVGSGKFYVECRGTLVEVEGVVNLKASTDWDVMGTGTVKGGER
jgi:hypothetical protein